MIEKNSMIFLSVLLMAFFRGNTTDKITNDKITFLESNTTNPISNKETDFIEDDPRIIISKPDKKKNVYIKYANGLIEKISYKDYNNKELLMINGTFVPEKYIDLDVKYNTYPHLPISVLPKYFDIQIDYLSDENKFTLKNGNEKIYSTISKTDKPDTYKLGDLGLKIVDNNAYFNIYDFNKNECILLGDTTNAISLNKRKENIKRSFGTNDGCVLIEDSAREAYNKIMDSPNISEIKKAKFKKDFDPTKIDIVSFGNYSYRIYKFSGYRNSGDYYIFFNLITGKLYSVQICNDLLRIEEGFLNIEALVN